MTNAVASGADAAVLAAGIDAKTQAVQSYILHHMADSHEWSLPFATLRLPGFVSLHGVMAVLAAFVLVAVCGLSGRGRGPVPRGAANLIEAFVVFIRDQIARPHLGEDDGRRMTPFFCSLFFFILAMNLIGLLPSFSTATADVSVTGAMALVILSVMIGGAIWRHGVAGFFRGFIPHGVAWPILILLLPVEILGLFIKAFALTIRLFANMLAGHIVLYFMLGLVLVFGVWAAPLFGVAMFIFLLELFVAFLQAYIFTMLSAVFIGQRLHPDH